MTIVDNPMPYLANNHFERLGLKSSVNRDPVLSVLISAVFGKRRIAIAFTAIVIIVTFIFTISGVAIAQDDKAPIDLELDFKFLRLGLTRKAVIDMLGAPNGTVESQTLAVKNHKLIWLGADGKKFTAAFVHNRLWRWKTCTAELAEC